MPNRTVKKVKRAGKRAIDRLPSHERMALFHAILRLAVYFAFCGSHQCRTSRMQSVSTYTNVVPTSLAATSLVPHNDRSLPHFEIYPRNRLRAVEIFISRMSTRPHEVSISLPFFFSFFYAASSSLRFLPQKRTQNRN